MFRCADGKVCLTINLNLKITFENKNYKSTCKLKSFFKQNKF